MGWKSMSITVHQCGLKGHRAFFRLDELNVVSVPPEFSIFRELEAMMPVDANRIEMVNGAVPVSVNLQIRIEVQGMDPRVSDVLCLLATFLAQQTAGPLLQKEDQLDGYAVTQPGYSLATD